MTNPPPRVIYFNQKLDPYPIAHVLDVHGGDYVETRPNHVMCLEAILEIFYVIDTVIGMDVQPVEMPITFQCTSLNSTVCTNMICMTSGLCCV